MNNTEAQPSTITVPSRWDWTNRSRVEVLQELDKCAQILVKGTEALSGLYLKMCDMIREHGLTDDEIRVALCKHFPPPRISEFLKVARAPDLVYRRYRAGFVGFKAVLAECRGYRIHQDEWLKRRKIRRAAERLMLLMPQGGSVEVCGRKLDVH